MNGPKPGSPEAVEAGCTCPIIDNAKGRGAGWGGAGTYWINQGCPLHDRDAELGAWLADNAP